MKLGWKKCIDCETFFDWRWMVFEVGILDEFDFWGNKLDVVCDLCHQDRLDEEGEK